MSSKKNSLLNFSAHESEVMGLRIARASQRFDQIPVHELKREIAAGEFDLCKIKVRADQPNIFSQLDQLGIPYQMTSVLYRNVKEISPQDGQYRLPAGIEYEPYDGSQAEILRSFVEAAVGRPTGVNFEVWPFNQLFSPEKELALSKAYALGFDHRPGNPNLAWLLKDEGEYVGFFMGTFGEDHFEGTLYGVPPQYRRRGYGKVIYDIMKMICFERGIRYFFTDVQLQNVASQQSTLHGGLQPTGFYFHFFLGSFLQFGRKESRTISVAGMKAGEVQQAFLQTCEAKGFPADLKWVPFFEGDAPDWMQMECWSPYSSAEASLQAGRLSDRDGRLLGMLYARF